MPDNWKPTNKITKKEIKFQCAMLALAVVGLVCAGCSIVSSNRTFPKLTWYWSGDAKQQRFDRAWEKQQSQPITNSPAN